MNGEGVFTDRPGPVPSDAKAISARIFEANRRRFISVMEDRLTQTGGCHLIPAGVEVMDRIREHVAAPDPTSFISWLDRVMSGVLRSDGSPVPLAHCLFDLRALVHRILRGTHRPAQVIQESLTLTGDALDCATGFVFDRSRRGDPGDPPAGWTTLVEVGKTRRQFHTLSRIIRDLLGTRDPDQMYRTLETGILDTFSLRSLMIATVDDREGVVEVVRAFPASVSGNDPIGWRYDLGFPDILCEVARSGRPEVIDGWDVRYHEQVRLPHGGRMFRKRPPEYNQGQTAYFVPILAGARVIGMVCTASAQVNKDEVLREIETMGPFLDQVGATLSTISEIMERDRAEAALRESERRFRTFVETAQEGIYAIDADRLITYANQRVADMLGHSIRELIGRPSLDFMDETGREQAGRNFERRRQGIAEVHEFRFTRRDGTPLWCLLATTPLSDAEGKFAGAVAMVTDITEQKRARERLEQSEEQMRNLSARLQLIREEERSRIAREVHDELGQALTVLKMDLSWLSRRIPRDLRREQERAAMMSGLIDETLQAVRRISTELRPGILDDLGLVAAIEWQAEEFQNRTGIETLARAHPEDLMIDPARSTAVFRILQETLTNVVRHANATQVRIELGQANGSIHLEVKDNGRGITPEQISSSRSMGLVGMRERAAVFGGEVEIWTVQGEGTGVRVRIPGGVLEGRP